MLAVSIVAVVLAGAALAVGIVGLVQSHRAAARADAANEISRASNEIAQRADDRAQETADRAADTVEWRLTWQAPGRLVFVNTSREHTANDVKIIASLGRLPAGSGPGFPWPWRMEPGTGGTVGPQMPIVADYGELAARPDVTRALEASGPTVYMLISAVTWISERGVKRQQWNDPQIVVLEVGAGPTQTEEPAQVARPPRGRSQS